MQAGAAEGYRVKMKTSNWKLFSLDMRNHSRKVVVLIPWSWLVFHDICLIRKSFSIKI